MLNARPLARLLLLALLAGSAQAQPATSQPGTNSTGTTPPAAPTTPPGLAPDATLPADADVLAADAAIYSQHIFTLANPFFEGRCPGTRGNKDAAEYLRFYMAQSKLEPAFTDEQGQRTYFQPFTPARFRGGTQTILTQTAAWKVGAVATELKPDEDFRALGCTADAHASAGLVFVGYGIDQDNSGYTSFTGEAKLEGKIALLLRFEPMSPDGQSKWAKEGWSPASRLDDKIDACLKRGAEGVIVVNPPGVLDERGNRLMTTKESAFDGQEKHKPVVMLSTEAADALVQTADPKHRSLKELRLLADSSGDAFDLSAATVTLETKLDRNPIITNNVGGILRGKGALADEFIVIGSHYDHVGYGEFGSRSNAKGQIHPGADDNASGTCGNLLLVRKLAAHYASLPPGASTRSILFLGFSAEESGLEGSAYYCKHMVMPKDKNSLMINLDMIGRLRDGPPLEATGVASAVGLRDWLQPYFDTAGFPIAVKDRAPGNSDHASFFNVGVPIVFVFTGLHDEYHTPNDTADLINVQGAVKVTDLAYRLAIDAAKRPARFVFAKDEPKPVAKQGDTPADPAADQPARPTGVRFGIAPADYADDKKGVLIGDVFDGTPAAKAGLKKGDRMMTWNGAAIDTVEAWMPLLRKHKPGDKVDIVFQRDGKEDKVTVTLEARGTPAR